MRKIIGWGLVLATAGVAVLAFGTACPAGAKDKGSKGKPPGWDKGEKEGWPGDVPPGLEKKGGWMPPGLRKKETEEWQAAGGPPGWAKGKKKGWRGGTMPPGLAKKGKLPPGWAKWSEEEQQGWEKALGEALVAVNDKAPRVKGFTEEDLDSALVSLEMTAREGVPVEHARCVVITAMDEGLSGQGMEKMTRAVAYGVGKGIDFDKIDKYVEKNLQEGLKDDGLAIAVYEEVARGHEKAVEAKGKAGQE